MATTSTTTRGYLLTYISVSRAIRYKYTLFFCSQTDELTNQWFKKKKKDPFDNFNSLLTREILKTNTNTNNFLSDARSPFSPLPALTTTFRCSDFVLFISLSRSLSVVRMKHNCSFLISRYYLFFHYVYMMGKNGGKLEEKWHSFSIFWE